MPKILVIPDTHLKPEIFNLADKILRERKVDYAVQLGDNVDDFYAYHDEYTKHAARMEKFYLDHPETIWLWGNHEISYLLRRAVTGNTIWGEQVAKNYERNFRPKFAHRDGKVIFSHAGIFREFLDEINLGECKTVGVLMEKINNLPADKFWNNNSLLWARPQVEILTTPKILEGYVQVVGHTPMKDTTKQNGVVSTDVFSTNWGKKIGSEQLIIVDSETGKFEQVDIDFRKAFGI